MDKRYQPVFMAGSLALYVTFAWLMGLGAKGITFGSWAFVISSAVMTWISIRRERQNERTL